MAMYGTDLAASGSRSRPNKTLFAFRFAELEVSGLGGRCAFSKNTYASNVTRLKLSDVVCSVVVYYSRCKIRHLLNSFSLFR